MKDSLKGVCFSPSIYFFVCLNAYLKKNIHDNIKSSIVWKGTHFWFVVDGEPTDGAVGMHKAKKLEEMCICNNPSVHRDIEVIIPLSKTQQIAWWLLYPLSGSF